MPLDARALARAIGADAGNGLETVHATLCRREAAAFQRAAKSGDDLLVACTQESRLFLELNAATEGAAAIGERPIRFVNIRETGGWSKDAVLATPKIAALIAAAQLPDAEPVGTVGYASAGRVLVIGDAQRALRAAARLGDALDVSLLLTDRHAEAAGVPQERTMAVHAGSLAAISGWLGAFQVTWRTGNPIDLDLCTRCNACIAVCPEQAIGFAYQIDLAKCSGHRDCVRACEAAAAIDFERPVSEVVETFDLVLDLGAAPALAMHQPPQGYFHAASDAALIDAALKLRGLVGEFEKPRFFQYKQKLCAHSRNETIGCTACIDVCSTSAIRSDASQKGRTGKAGNAGHGLGGGIVVEPHLCVGCGACSTVCPSGALTFAVPRPNEMGVRLRTLLATYQRAGGVAQAGPAALLLHSGEAGAAAIVELGRAASADPGVRGVPARVLPVEAWHTASIGIDLWLAAIAYGAAQVWVLMTDEEAPEYRHAIAEQMRVAEAILEGLGFAGEHFRIVDAAGIASAASGDVWVGPANPLPNQRGRTGRRADDRLLALDRALQAAPAVTVQRAATFAVQADKRATLDLAIDHLTSQAPALAAAGLPEAIALPASGSPFGSLGVDADACTMCLACVGACPEAALADNPQQPQLRFIESNCVQCGLCASTCPEDAIRLEPRLWLADAGQARRRSRVLNEAPPFACVRCGKPFGTLKAVELMAAKLSGHAMFQGAAAARLKMCGECRVIDMHRNTDEVKIGDL